MNKNNTKILMTYLNLQATVAFTVFFLDFGALMTAFFFAILTRAIGTGVSVSASSSEDSLLVSLACCIIYKDIDTKMLELINHMNKK